MDTALLHTALRDPGPRSGRGERGRSVLGGSKAQMPNPQRQRGPPPPEQHGLWVSLCGVLGGLQGGCQGEGDGLGFSLDPVFHLLTWALPYPLDASSVQRG